MEPITICTLAAPVVSALISYLVAKQTASSELKKLQASWQREDSINFERCFADAVQAVALFADHQNGPTQGNALALVGRMRALADGSLAAALDSLYAFLDHDSRPYSNRGELSELLTAVIDEKRKLNGGQNQ